MTWERSEQLTRTTLGQFSLLESRTLNRPALDRWATSVSSRLRELLERKPDAWTSIGDCMNLAALIELSRGDGAGARATCEIHLRWVEGITHRNGIRTTGDLAIQPWINVGRLLRMEGDFPGALERFSLFPRHQDGNMLCMGGLHIDPESWRSILEAQPSISELLEVVYLVDSLKTLLMAKDYDGARAFIQRCREGDIRSAQPYLEEGELAALVGLGRHVEALEVTMRPEWGRNPFAKLVAAAYRATLLQILDEVSRARTVLETVARHLLGSPLEHVRTQRVLRLFLLLGVLSRDAGMQETAAGFLRMGLHATRGFDDELLESSFLNALLSLEALEDRGRLEEARMQLLRRTFYAPLRGALGPSAIAPEEPPVFGSLRHAIKNLVTAD